MSLTFDFDAVPPRDRADALHNVLARTDSLPLEISHLVAPERIRVSGAVADVGGLCVFSIRTSPLILSRTAAMARDDFEPSLLLRMQLSGSSLITQDDREVLIRAGDMNLVDTTRPYRSLDPSVADHHFIRVSRSRLALPDSVLRHVTATRLAREDPVVRLVWTFFRTLADRGVPLASVPGAAVMDSPGAELIRGLICHQAGQARLGREPAENTLAMRVMSYARAHLDDPDLSAVTIARAHHVSVRQLYTVLEKADIALGPWIRSRRLEECRLDLARPEAQSLTIAAIARRRGFMDATHFGRAFRNAYGLSPRQWRDQLAGRRSP